MAATSFNPNSGTSGTTTDAEWRTWCTAFANALAAVGLIQTADTGQINLATAVRPAISTAAGYQIWRFDDALQATAPIFIKIEYGVGSNVNWPAIWITVGSSTDGAGNINSTHNSARRSFSTATTASPVISRMSAGEGRWSFVLHHPISGASSSAGSAWHAGCVERLRNANGDATAEGFVMLHLESSGTRNIITVPAPQGTSPYVETNLPIVPPMSGSTGVIGTDVGLFPIAPLRAWQRDPIVSFIGYFQADFPVNNAQSVSLHGTSRSYITVAGSTTGNAVRNGSNIGLMMVNE